MSDEPALCECGVPVAETTLAHYMTCSGDVPEDEAAEMGRVLSEWASRELEAMGDDPDLPDTPPPKED